MEGGSGSRLIARARDEIAQISIYINGFGEFRLLDGLAPSMVPLDGLAREGSLPREIVVDWIIVPSSNVDLVDGHSSSIMETA